MRSKCILKVFRIFIYSIHHHWIGGWQFTRHVAASHVRNNHRDTIRQLSTGILIKIKTTKSPQSHLTATHMAYVNVLASWCFFFLQDTSIVVDRKRDATTRVTRFFFNISSSKFHGGTNERRMFVGCCFFLLLVYIRIFIANDAARNAEKTHEKNRKDIIEMRKMPVQKMRLDETTYCLLATKPKHFPINSFLSYVYQHYR